MNHDRIRLIEFQKAGHDFIFIRMDGNETIEAGSLDAEISVADYKSPTGNEGVKDRA